MVRSANARFAARTGVAALCLALLVGASLTGAAKRPLKNLKYDPAARAVELFEGLESGELEATVIPKDSLSSNVFIENKTDQPITVKLPKAVVMVQVLKQGFGGGAAGGGLGAGGPGGGQGGIGGGGGQAGGGGFGGGQQFGGGGGGFGGGGFGGGAFSVPPERVAQLPLVTVCLEHGKADPNPKMRYKLVKLETYTSDPVLQELITMVGTGRLDAAIAQAATWHVANDMSWEKLAAKSIRRVGGLPPEPYFAPGQLAAARELVLQATARVRQREKEEGNPREGGRQNEKRI